MKNFHTGSYFIGALAGVLGVILFCIVLGWPRCDPPPTPAEYTKNGMTYIEFPRGSVANYTLDSMAKGSRVILEYKQVIRPCK